MPSVATSPKPRSRWRFFRFSLRTLLIVTVFIGSCGALWIKRAPWRVTGSVRIEDADTWMPSPDYSKVAILAASGIYLIDLDHMETVQHVKCERQLRVEWALKSGRFMTITGDSGQKSVQTFELTLWNTAPLKPVRSSSHKPKYSTDFAFALSRDGTRVFTSGFESGGLRCTDADSGAVIWESAALFSQLALDPTGRFLFTGAQVLDTASGKVVWSAKADRPIVGGVHAFSADGRWFALAFPREQDLWELHLLDTAAFHEHFSEERSTSAYEYLRFSPSGTLLGVIMKERSHGYTVDFRRPEDGQRVRQLSSPTVQYFEYCDDTHIIYDCQLLELNTNRVVAKYRDSPSFSPDNLRALVNPAPNFYTLYDIKTGNELFELPSCRMAQWIDANRIFCEDTGHYFILTRVRPEGALGLVTLPEFWAALLSLLGVTLSLRADWRKKVTA